MKYLSVMQTAEKRGISNQSIQTLCGEDRKFGASSIGYAWAIPENAEKSVDVRIKSGKDIKPKADDRA